MRLWWHRSPVLFLHKVGLPPSVNKVLHEHQSPDLDQRTSWALALPHTTYPWTSHSVLAGSVTLFIRQYCNTGAIVLCERPNKSNHWNLHNTSEVYTIQQNIMYDLSLFLMKNIFFTCHHKGFIVCFTKYSKGSPWFWTYICDLQTYTAVSKLPVLN